MHEDTPVITRGVIEIQDKSFSSDKTGIKNPLLLFIISKTSCCLAK